MSLLLPTGLTLLNLALSDTKDGGIEVGRIANIIGDASTGKTLLALTMLAEAASSEKFDEYRLIYDDAEAALGFDLERMFGSRLVSRLEEPPEGHSDSMELFYSNVLQLLQSGEKFIYVLDSFDSLYTAEDDETAEEVVKSGRFPGSYGTAKARKASEIMRKISGDLSRTESILVILSQTRDDIGAVFGKKKTRSGGRALDFYSSYIIWLNHKGKIERSGLVVGNHVLAEIRKNKYTGKLRNVEFAVYYEFGVDDVGSILKFLIAVKAAKMKTRQTIEIPDLELTGTATAILKEVLSDGEKYERLKKLAEDKWLEREAKVQLGIKSKYVEEQNNEVED